jgi:hypothetical protein
MPTPRLSRQQLAAAATQLRGGDGIGPHRVLVANVSTALETSAATSRKEHGRVARTMRKGARCGRPTATLATPCRRMAAERCTELGAAAALEVTRLTWGRRRLVFSTRFHSEKVLMVDGAAATALGTAGRSRSWRRCFGVRLIVKLPDLVIIMDVIGFVGSSGREGLTGEILAASMFHWAAVNVISIGTGAGMVMGSKVHPSARRADCGLPLLAHCKDLSRRVLKDFNAMVAPYPRICLVLRRTGIRDRVRLTTEGSASGRLVLLPMTTTGTSVGAYGANRRS